jgi:HD-GYP domain-containing protein (c-di-GMP phosphodiesterase class II)
VDTSRHHIQNLFEISIALSNEKDIYNLLEKIVLLTRKFTNADAGTLYMLENSKLFFRVVQTESLNIFIGGDGIEGWRPVELFKDDGTENFSNVSAVCALKGDIIVIEDCYNEPDYDFSGTKEFDKVNGYRTKSMIVIPIKDFEGEVIGVLQLINKMDQNRNIISFGKFDVESAEALASQATVSIVNTRLFNEMNRFLERFMRSIGDAVDAKSPYTGDHVRKVGRFVKMIAEEIDRDRTVFKDIKYNGDKQHLLEIAAWLHDIGKITIPDHIMDKATKLQTIFDRIELIRERFEIVKKELKISLLEGKIDDDFYHKRLDDLDEDFQFLYQVNFGGEFMREESIERVREIAKIRYWMEGREVNLLRGDEVENLTIKKGTLTEAERQKIMSHAEMTYRMLEEIPFPRNFHSAKDVACNHHEKLNGKGYPRGLSANKLTIDDRLLAIVDVFEALSSSDRPYKSPKKLSEIFKILSFMVKDGDIDGDIVKFIFDSKVYLQYAEQEMLPEQIDEPKLFF